MYNNGAQAMSDFFAMELRDGYLTMVLDLGSGAINVKCHPNRMDDGEWHFVKVNKNKKRGTVEVDEDTMPFVLGGQNKQLDLEGSLFIGGIDSGSNSMLLPREIWSGMLGFGFVGCMRDLVMNGVPVDLAEIARTTAALDVGVYCSAQPAKCNSDPCLNMGVCSEGWNRFICDCSATGFVGTTCSEDAVTLSFDGTQYLRVGFENEELSDREDVRLRFKTKRAYGILMSTVATNGIDTLMLELDSGRVKLTLNLGAGSIELFSGIGLNDMQWHTVKIERTLQHVKMWIDEEEVIEGNTDGTNDVLEFYSIEIGALSDSAKANMLVTPSNFLGHMEQFVLNNQHFFEMANEGVGNIEYTADFDDMDKQIISEPVTFKTRDAYVVLSPPKTYPDLNLFFQFKTVEADGLILFNDGDGNDFMGVELVDGYIHYVYNTGDKTSVMIANTVTRLNNNAWHEVSVTRDNRDRLVLKVDDATTKAQSSSGPRHIDLTENMRVGGVEREMYDILPEMVESKNGFLGCMASLDLNGKVPDLINDALNGMTDSVVQGCEGPSQTCSADSCLNQGICNQLWDSYTCDCDMTTFTGSMCEIRGTKADFSNNGGLITFTYPERSRPTTYSDRLAIGFRTKSSDAVLARIDSSSSDDYIEVEIEEGNLFVVYNVGTDDHPIGRVLKKVNDGKYHVMRFHRIGQNATLQLDDEPVREMFPAGDQSKVFNDQTFVKLGARGQVKNRERRDLDRKYVGLMQGVFYNDIKVLDKGVARDSSVTVEGDVALRQSSQPGVKTTPSSPKASSPVMTTQMKALTPAKPVFTSSAPYVTTPPNLLTQQPTKVASTVPTSMPTTASSTTTVKQSTTIAPISTSKYANKPMTTEPVGPGEPGVETTTDDIYIEIGSGCNSDDEDDCDMSGSGEIPKPVGPSVGRTTTMAGVTEPKTTVPAMMTTKARMTTVKSTAQPTTRAPPKMTTPMVIDQATTLEPMIPEGSGVKCEGTDDEDCETDESGSGEIPIPMEPTTKSMMVEITKMTESPLTQPMKSKTTQAVMPPSSTTMVPEKGITTTAMMTDIKIELTTLKPMTNVTKKMQPIETNKQTEKPPSSKPTQTTAAEEGIAGPIAESSKNAGQTAMVIGIVAAVCIAVLILLYAIYKYRNRNEGSYRIDESRNYSYGAPNNTVVMPNANGALYNGKDGINKPLMKKQDSREWYV
ncbi:neurexin-3 [Saccoglossus kowalevskii]